MSKEKRTNLLYVAIGIGVISCTAFAYIYNLGPAPKKIVEKFWQLSLDNKMDEAKSLTAMKADLKSNHPAGTYGMTRGANLDGTDTDWVYRQDIYDRQIKIDRVTETEKSGYRVGVRVETTDKEGKKGEYIACLGQSETDNSWKLFYVTLSNFDSKPEKIEDKCFEKIGR